MGYTIQDFKAFKSEGAVTLPFELTLRKPVVLGSDVIEVLTFNREPTAGDAASLPVTDMKQGDFITLLSKVTGQTDVMIKKLSYRDFTDSLEILNYFLLGSEADSEAS